MSTPNPNIAVEMQTDDGDWLPITLLPANEWELARAVEELIESLDEPQPWTPSATDWDDYTYHRVQERNHDEDVADMEADR